MPAAHNDNHVSAKLANRHSACRFPQLQPLQAWWHPLRIFSPASCTSSIMLDACSVVVLRSSAMPPCLQPAYTMSWLRAVPIHCSPMVSSCASACSQPKLVNMMPKTLPMQRLLNAVCPDVCLDCETQGDTVLMLSVDVLYCSETVSVSISACCLLRGFHISAAKASRSVPTWQVPS